MTVLPSGADMPDVQPTLGELESSLSETQQQLTRLNERILSLQASNNQLTQQVRSFLWQDQNFGYQQVSDQNF